MKYLIEKLRRILKACIVLMSTPARNSLSLMSHQGLHYDTWNLGREITFHWISSRGFVFDKWSTTLLHKLVNEWLNYSLQLNALCSDNEDSSCPDGPRCYLALIFLFHYKVKDCVQDDEMYLLDVMHQFIIHYPVKVFDSKTYYHSRLVLLKDAFRNSPNVSHLRKLLCYSSGVSFNEINNVEKLIRGIRCLICSFFTRLDTQH